MFKGINVLEFNEAFNNDESCKAYLYKLKWSKGYRCARCGNAEFWRGRGSYHARCKSCEYDESVTANTLFHKIKIPLRKAFHMAFRIVISKKGVSTCALSREFGVSQESAWLFKRKLQESVSAEMEQTPEFRSVTFKTLLKGISINRRGVLLSEEESIAEIERFLHQQQEPGRAPFSRRRENLSYRKNGNEANLMRKNLIAHNFRIWINGIHHHCSTRFFTGYAGEYFFRLKHRKSMENLWHNVIKCFIQAKPYLYKPNGV